LGWYLWAPVNTFISENKITEKILLFLNVMVVEQKNALIN
jgi:hypothetical protein